MNTTFIVGLNGQARSGKDTLARILIDLLQHYNAHGQRVSFAQPLKEIYIAAWQWARNSDQSLREAWHHRLDALLSKAGCSVEHLDDVILWLANKLDWSDSVLQTIPAEETKVVHRRNLIDVGMHMRSIDPNFWVKAALAQIDPHAHFVFISDQRFSNEALACDYIVRVVRPDLPVIYNSGHDAIDQSEEYSLTGAYDWLVDNSGSVANLVSEASVLLDELFEQRVIKMHSQVA